MKNEIFYQAQIKQCQGKYACEALQELRKEYPRIQLAVLRKAIKEVRKEYDFPTKRELGIY